MLSVQTFLNAQAELRVAAAKVKEEFQSLTIEEKLHFALKPGHAETLEKVFDHHCHYFSGRDAGTSLRDAWDTWNRYETRDLSTIVEWVAEEVCTTGDEDDSEIAALIVAEHKDRKPRALILVHWLTNGISSACYDW